MKLGDIEIPTEAVGDTFKLEGVLYGDGKQTVALMLPDETGETDVEFTKPTEEEWIEFLKQTDDPVTPVGKAFVRKATRQLDQSIAWRCYARDNYTCVYCDKTGIPLTYDHYLAQTFGGQTTMENGRTSCRPCNKRKGHMTIDAWKAFAAQKGLHDGEKIAQTN
jgi:hypothetical protein